MGIDYLTGDDVTTQVFVNGERIINTRASVAETSRVVSRIEVQEYEHQGEKVVRLRSKSMGTEFDITIRPHRPLGIVLHKFLADRADGEASGSVEIRMKGVFRNGERTTMRIRDCHIENPDHEIPGRDSVIVKLAGKSGLKVEYGS